MGRCVYRQNPHKAHVTTPSLKCRRIHRTCRPQAGRSCKRARAAISRSPPVHELHEQAAVPEPRQLLPAATRQQRVVVRGDDKGGAEVPPRARQQRVQAAVERAPRLPRRLPDVVPACPRGPSVGPCMKPTTFRVTQTTAVTNWDALAPIQTAAVRKTSSFPLSNQAAPTRLQRIQQRRAQVRCHCTIRAARTGGC